MSYKDGSLEGWDPESKVKLHKEISAIETFGFEEGLAKLKAAMAKYIGFHTIRKA
jgi:hypothetical protein